MPVRIGQFTATIIQFRGNVIGHISTSMGQSQDNGAITAMDFHWGHLNQAPD